MMAEFTLPSSVTLEGEELLELLFIMGADSGSAEGQRTDVALFWCVYMYICIFWYMYIYISVYTFCVISQSMWLSFHY